MIKKLFIVFLFLMILPFVSAVGNLTVTPSTGSKTADVEEVVSGVLTINNSDSSNSLNVTLPSSIVFIGTEYNETISISYLESSPLTIASNSAADVNYEFTVPSDALAGDYVGVFNFTTSQTGSYDEHTFTITVYQALMLDIEDLDVVIDGDTDTNVGDGEKIDEKAKPGSDIELKIRIRNTFREDSDIDINDITVTAILIDNDDEEIDELDVDVGDLDADEKSDEELIIFELPLDIEGGEYSIEIEVEGEDDNGVDHSLEWIVYFDLERKSHEIIIYKSYLTPETVKCKRTSNLYVKLMNTGSRTEDEVRLTISNSDLGINVDKRDIELSKNPDNDDNTYTDEVSIDAKDVAAGTYPITIRVYYDEDLLDDIKTAELVVEDCPTAQPPKEEEKDEPVVVEQEPEPVVIAPVTEGEEIPTTTETSFTQSTGGIVLLLLGNVIVLAVVIFLITKFLIIPKLPKP